MLQNRLLLLLCTQPLGVFLNNKSNPALITLHACYALLSILHSGVMVEAVKNLRQAVCCISLSQCLAFGLWHLTYPLEICQYLNP